MEKYNNIPSWIASAITGVLSVASVEEVTRIILLIMGIVSGCFSLAYNIYCWYKRAKADGKITSEEIDEVVDITKDGIKKITEKSDEQDTGR